MKAEELYYTLKSIQEPKGYFFNRDTEKTTALLEGLLLNEGVILGDFRAELEDGSNAVLRWRTESEAKMLGFTVLRRLKGLEDGFAPVSDLIPATYSGQDQGGDYRFVDENLPGGAYQYRLEVVWLDGTADADGLAEVTVSAWRIFLPLAIK